MPSIHETLAQIGRLHIWVIRTVATLGGDPSDILAWVFDITGLTMHTVLEVNDKTWLCALFFDNFVYTCGAIPLCGFCVFRKVHSDWNVWIRQPQMRRLAFFVVGH